MSDSVKKQEKYLQKMAEYIKEIAEGNVKVKDLSEIVAFNDSLSQEIMSSSSFSAESEFGQKSFQFLHFIEKLNYTIQKYSDLDNFDDLIIVFFPFTEEEEDELLNEQLYKMMDTWFGEEEDLNFTDDAEDYEDLDDEEDLEYKILDEDEREKKGIFSRISGRFQKLTGKFHKSEEDDDIEIIDLDDEEEKKAFFLK